jgi:Sugar kinases, ribokinase family
VINLFQPVQRSLPTATSIVLVTPDAQRTMNKHFGCSGLVDASVINEERLREAGMVYLEGYLFDSPTARAAMEKAVTIMRQTGGKVALSLSDPLPWSAIATCSGA